MPEPIMMPGTNGKPDLEAKLREREHRERLDYIKAAYRANDEKSELSLRFDELLKASAEQKKNFLRQIEWLQAKNRTLQTIAFALVVIAAALIWRMEWMGR